MSKIKLKIVMYSDIHSKMHLVKEAPEGDMLLFAGDHWGGHPLDYEGQWKNLDKHLEELLKISDRFKYIILAFGNHDPAFDYNKYDSKEEALSVYQALWDREKHFNKKTKGARIYLTSGWAIHTKFFKEEFHVLTSPYSNAFGSSDWGFWWKNENHTKKYDFHHKDFKIVVSHESPLGYGDKTDEGEHVGSTQILDYLKRNNCKPKLIVSGHIHEGNGIRQGKGEWEGTTFVNASMLDEYYEPRKELFKVIEMEF